MPRIEIIIVNKKSELPKTGSQLSIYQVMGLGSYVWSDKKKDYVAIHSNLPKEDQISRNDSLVFLLFIAIILYLVLY